MTNKTKKGDLVDMKNSKALFTKMLLVARSHNLQLEDVFRYSLRPFPCSLATRKGDLVKTSKAKLLHVIEDKVKDCTVSQPETPNKACILDAMAIQTVAPVPGTFGELATHLLKRIVNIVVYSKCKRVDFVCDRYPHESIKNLERHRRAADGIQLIRIYGDRQKTPRLWKKFLSSGENKRNY